MFFVWGWGYQKIKEYGPILKHECTNCEHNVFWNLYTVTTWFTFFFIPIIPYKKSHIIQCSVCNNSINIMDEQFEYYKKVSEANLLYNNSDISLEEYKSFLRNLNEAFN